MVSSRLVLIVFLLLVAPLEGAFGYDVKPRSLYRRADPETPHESQEEPEDDPVKSTVWGVHTLRMLPEPDAKQYVHHGDIFEIANEVVSRHYDAGSKKWVEEVNNFRNAAGGMTPVLPKKKPKKRKPERERERKPKKNELGLDKVPAFKYGVNPEKKEKRRSCCGIKF